MTIKATETVTYLIDTDKMKRKVKVGKYIMPGLLKILETRGHSFVVVFRLLRDIINNHNYNDRRSYSNVRALFIFNENNSFIYVQSLF